MQTSLTRHVLAQFAPAGLPLYSEGCVPPDAPLPFAVADIRPCLTPGGRGRVTLRCCHAPDTPQGDALQAAEALLALIPAPGLPLWLPEGLAVLTPSASVPVACETSDAGRTITLTLDLALYLSARPAP
jgi:hypothetical protein